MNPQDHSSSTESMTKITVTQLLPMVYQDALQPGVKQLGVALESVLSLVPTLMLPFKFVSEAAKLRLSMRLDKLRKNLEAKALEDILAIAPEIGVPVIEKLLHTQDEQLANLYLQLLAQASDVKGQQFAHPSFPTLIGNLSPDEAALLQIFTDEDASQTWPALHFYIHAPNIMPVLLRGPLTGWERLVHLQYPNNMPAYLVNLTRCGIFEQHARIDSFTDFEAQVRYPEFGTEQKRIAAQLSKYYRPNFGQTLQEDSQIHSNTGVIHLTEYGQMFIRACVVPQPDLLTGVTL